MPRVGAKTIEESRQWLEDFMVSLGKTASCNEHVNEVAYRAGLSRSTLRNIMANEPGTGKPAGYCKALGDKSRAKLIYYRDKINKINVTDKDDIETITNRQKSISKAISDHRYEIIKDHATGDWAIVRLVAVFKNGGDAQEYVNWLNRQIDCGLKNS